jgi:hypothetical protein
VPSVGEGRLRWRAGRGQLGEFGVEAEVIQDASCDEQVGD